MNIGERFNPQNLFGGKDNAAAADDDLTSTKRSNNNAEGGEKKEEEEAPESSSRSKGGNQEERSTTNNNNNDDDDDEEKPSANEEEEFTENEEKEQVHLSKKHELQGYIVLFASSAVNCTASNQSNVDENITLGLMEIMRPIPASESARNFALANAGVVGGLAALALVAHFDRFSCLKGIWMKLFGPKALFEKLFLAFLVIWCAAATWVNTSVRGLAGPGKGQFDIYFTTWINFIASIWTLERWYISAGHSSFYTFFSSWPHRGFAWIGFFIASLSDFFFVLDVKLNWEDGTKRAPLLYRLYDEVPEYQWVILMVVCILSSVVSLVFSAAELFRISKVGVTSEKATWENMTEGGILLVLVGCWLYCVIITTSPGGLGSMYGNVYFFTWTCAVIVIKTFLWWVRDWRRDIHLAVEKEHEEYEKAKQAVLAQNMHSYRDDDF